MTAPDFPDYGVPQAHATAILDTGVPSSLNPLIASYINVAPTGGIFGALGAQFTTGGGYEIAITPNGSGGGCFLIDLLLTHSDPLGNDTLIESMTVGNQASGTAQNTNGGVIIRGNLHGSQLSLGGTAATTAIMTSMLNYASGSPAVGGFDIGIYAVPFLQESQPRVAPIGDIPGLLGQDSGATFTAVSGSVLDYGPLASYCGPAAHMTAVGDHQGGGFQFTGRIDGLTVNGGATPKVSLFSMCVDGTVGSTLQDLVLPAMLLRHKGIQFSGTAARGYVAILTKANM